MYKEFFLHYAAGKADAPHPVRTVRYGTQKQNLRGKGETRKLQAMRTAASVPVWQGNRKTESERGGQNRVVKATVTMEYDSIVTMYFRDFLELSDWMEAHHGEYIGLDSFLTDCPPSMEN
jgi:hypothetical protein